MIMYSFIHGDDELLTRTFSNELDQWVHKGAIIIYGEAVRKFVGGTIIFFGGLTGGVPERGRLFFSTEGDQNFFTNAKLGSKMTTGYHKLRVHSSR